MSDIEYLSIKEFDGKLRSAEGFLSATGTLVTLTANTGKDMYLARAQAIVFMNTVNAAAIQNKVELKLNGTTIETFHANVSMVTSTGLNEIVYEFKNIGQKVAAGEIIKLEITVNDSDADVEGFIECFEETTGESPQI